MIICGWKAKQILHHSHLSQGQWVNAKNELHIIAHDNAAILILEPCSCLFIAIHSFDSTETYWNRLATHESLDSFAYAQMILMNKKINKYTRNLIHIYVYYSDPSASMYTHTWINALSIYASSMTISYEYLMYIWCQYKCHLRIVFVTVPNYTKIIQYVWKEFSNSKDVLQNSKQDKITPHSTIKKIIKQTKFS